MQPGQVDSDPVDYNTASAIGLVARALDFYERRQQQYSADRDHEPKVNSPVANANATGYLGRLPIALSMQLDVLARDHLRTIQVSLSSGLVPNWSIYSLARVAVETAARSWWILAPDDPRERTARSILAQLKMLNDRRVLEAGTGTARQRIDQLVDEARAAGFAVATNKKGVPTKVAGQGFTNNTSVLGQMLPTPGPDTGTPHGEFLYRVLSAAAHGNDWMFLTHAKQHGEIDDDGYGLVRAQANPALVARAVLATVRAHVTALDRWCVLCGWPRFSSQPFYDSGVENRLTHAIAALVRRSPGSAPGLVDL